MSALADPVRARVEIAEVVARYGNYLDAGDFDGLESLFADDASFDIDPAPDVPLPLRGSRAIREFIESRFKVVIRQGQRRHIMSNVVVEELGERTARVRTALTVFHVARAPGSAVEVHGMGVYDDVLELRAGGWVFAERRLTMDRADYFSPGWLSAE